MKGERMAWIALGIVSFFWGTTYLAIRIGVMHFPPFLFTGIRMAFGGIIMGMIWLFQKRTFRLTWKILGKNALAGIFFFTLGVGMVGWSEQYIPSGLAALLCSFPPIWLVIFNVFIFRMEKLNPWILFGILLGFGGTILVFREHFSELLNARYRLAVGVVVLANIGWVLASLGMKKENPSQDSVLNASIQMLSGGIFLFILSFFFEQQVKIVWTAPVVYSMIYLIIFGSVLAFWAYLYALSHLPLSLVSLHNYINVLVSIILGSLVLNEKLNPIIFMSVIITLIGIYFVNKGLNQNKKTELAHESPLE